jgi:DNA-binding MarR family transcriptional regulator
MSVSSARIAALLGRMEEKGLISRQGDPKDNRQVIVTLLADGKAIAEQLHAKALRQTASLLEALGPEDAREYVRLQHKLMDARRQTAAETP